MCAGVEQDQPIDQIGPIRTPAGLSGVFQAIDHSAAGSMTAQSPGFRPSALRLATHGQQVTTWGELLTFYRDAVTVFYCPSRQGRLIIM